MEINVGDFIILTEYGKDFFYIPSDELESVYVVFETDRNLGIVYAYYLGDQPDSEIIISYRHFRLATESEIKSYKLKKIFDKRSRKYGI